MQRIQALYELRGLGGLSWSDADQGWLAAPADVVGALVSAGFVECESATASVECETPPAGVWRGRHPRTGSLAAATWARHPPRTRTIVLITIDAEALVAADRVARPREETR